MKRSKFKLLLSGVIILVLLLLGISASFGVYYKQYTTLMKMYAEQYASLIHYQKSASNDDPNPTYSIMMRYRPIDNMRSLSNDQTQQTQQTEQTGQTDQNQQTEPTEQQYTHHQKIYQIKTLPAKHTLADTSPNQKYNITHHHVEKISSTNVKDDEIDNVLLFRSDGSINILTYEEYLQEEEQLKDLSDEELGFEKFDTKTATSIERHQHLGVLDDRPSLHVSGNIMGDIDVSKKLVGNIQVNSIQGGITISENLVGNIQAKSIQGDIDVSNNLVGNVQVNSLKGDIDISDNLVGNIQAKSLTGNIDISESLEGHFSAKTITLENAADGKAAINVGDINSANDGIHISGDVISKKGVGIHVGRAVQSELDGIHIEGSIESTNGNGIHIAGDVISKKGVGIHVGRAVQSELDGIRIDGTVQSELDGIRTAISSENGYALNISGNINAAGGLLVQNGNITTNGKQLDPSSEPYAGVRMKCVQNPETNKCTVGGYIVTKDAFGVQLEGGVQTTIVQGIDMGIHLRAAVEIGNVVSDGQGISIGDVSTQNGQGISIGDVYTQNGLGVSAQHITSKEGHAISVLTAASTYESVDSSQTGSDYPSVIQVRNIETDSPNVDGIRVSKVSTNTGIAIHVYETDTEDEPGVITSKGIGIKVGDKKDGSYRIETVDTSISVQGGVKSTDGLGISLNGDVISEEEVGIYIDGNVQSELDGIHIDGDIVSKKGVGINIGKTVQSELDGIHIDNNIISKKGVGIHVNGDVQSDHNSAIVIDGGLITHAGDNIDTEYYAFKANYIDASQNTASPIKSGPYGVHVGWIKSYNDSIHIGRNDDDVSLLSNSSAINIGGDVIGARRNIELTEEQKDSLKQANDQDSSALTDVKNNIISELSTQAVINIDGSIELSGFNTTVTVNFDTSSGVGSFNSRFNPIQMIRVGQNINTSDSTGITTDGIHVQGSMLMKSGDAIYVGGDIYGSNGFVLDGAMKDIKNTAILIQNNKNEIYAIKAQNGIILGSISPSTKGSIHFSNYGIDIRGDVTTESGGLGIRVQGNVESQQTTIRVTGNVKQKSDRHEANAIAVGGNVESVGSDAVSVNGNVIGAKSGILVKGYVKSSATKWTCYSDCSSGHESNSCQTCISKLKSDKQNFTNFYPNIPAAINVKQVLSENMGYGINVWANIDASNDAIRVNNDFDTEKPAVQSYYGTSIYINNDFDTEKPAVKSYYGPSIHINGDLVTEDYTSTVYLNGSVINNFYIQNITQCFDQNTRNYTYENDPVGERVGVAAVYIKEAKTILPNIVDSTTNNDGCRSGIQRTANGIIIDRVESFNDSIVITKTISSTYMNGIKVNSGVDIYGNMTAINVGTCSSFRSVLYPPLTLNYAAIQKLNNDGYSIQLNGVYVNRQIYNNDISKNEFNDDKVCGDIKPIS